MDPVVPEMAPRLRWNLESSAETHEDRMQQMQDQLMQDMKDQQLLFQARRLKFSEGRRLYAAVEGQARTGSNIKHKKTENSRGDGDWTRYKCVPI